MVNEAGGEESWLVGLVEPNGGGLVERLVSRYWFEALICEESCMRRVCGDWHLLEVIQSLKPLAGVLSRNTLTEPEDDDPDANPDGKIVSLGLGVPIPQLPAASHMLCDRNLEKAMRV